MTTSGLPASLSARPPRRWLRWVKRIVLGCVVLVLLLVTGGSVYEWLATRAEAKRFPQEGRLVDIGGGTRLNINCTGSAPAGTPTVILESGLGVPAIGWKLVQPEIAKLTRVCSYDRAGYGWSDPAKTPRDSSQLAKDLHALLQNASVAPPYVLVGHSLGGYNIRVYHSLYPAEVVGAVFVDSSHEDQNQYLPASAKKFQEDALKETWWKPILYRVLLNTGILRLLQQKEPGMEVIPKDMLEEMEYLQRNSVFLKVTADEFRVFDESANEVRKSGNFGNKPLVVLTAARILRDQDVPPGISKQELADFQKIWITQLQPQIVRLSTRGKQEVVENSGHMIPMEQPQRVIDAVRDVLQLVQQGQHAQP